MFVLKFHMPVSNHLTDHSLHFLLIQIKYFTFNFSIDHKNVKKLYQTYDVDLFFLWCISPTSHFLMILIRI